MPRPRKRSVTCVYVFGVSLILYSLLLDLKAVRETIMVVFGTICTCSFGYRCGISMARRASKWPLNCGKSWPGASTWHLTIQGHAKVSQGPTRSKHPWPGRCSPCHKCRLVVPLPNQWRLQSAPRRCTFAGLDVAWTSEWVPTAFLVAFSLPCSQRRRARRRWRWTCPSHLDRRWRRRTDTIMRGKRCRVEITREHRWLPRPSRHMPI